MAAAKARPVCACNLRLICGSVVGERFRLERELGAGSSGSVWGGTELASRRHAALKFLTGTGGDAAARNRRCQREARALMRVRHPNVVTLREALLLADGTPVLVLDLLDGETLAELLARRGCLPLAELARLMVPLIAAVAAIHRAGIVHRDLKPANIHVPRVGAAGRVCVLDFGACKLLGEATALENAEALGEVVGTPLYMAPEQAFADPTLDHRADIFSLGVIAYEALVGQRPYAGATLGQVMKHVLTEPSPRLPPRTCAPSEVAAMVCRMMACDPNDRPADLREPLELFAAHGCVSAARALAGAAAANA